MKSFKRPCTENLAFVISFTALFAVATDAIAGGFAIREQSTSSQGASFAGNAAGGDLSSIFWNPAATGVKSGINTESHTSIIVPRADVEVSSVSNPAINSPNPAVAGGAADILGAFNAADPHSGDIGQLALVGASYANYQINNRLWIGMGVNSGFGLSSKPNDVNYQASPLGRSTKLLTLNANPTIAYQVAPGILIGAGLQVQYADGRLKFATGVPQAASTFFDGDDWAFGATAGILLQPTAGTSIGLGYRSQISHTLEGTFATVGGPSINAEADVDLPDIVTLSLRQSLTPTTRLLGTVEWSNWSRFEDLTVVATGDGVTALTDVTTAGTSIGSIPANWSDGWFFALGLEYDHSPNITLRGGVAYEISPVDSPEKRIVTIPDSDRIWLSAGATIKVTEHTSVDIAYTHVFLEDADFDRETLTGPAIPLPATELSGSVEAAVDIVSFSMKTKW